MRSLFHRTVPFALALAVSAPTVLSAQKADPRLEKLKTEALQKVQERSKLVQEIIDQLEKDETAAVVISSDGKAVDGIVSNTSIVRGVRQFGRNVVDQPVRDLMTKAVITCDINQPLTTIYELMDRH